MFQERWKGKKEHKQLMSQDSIRIFNLLQYSGRVFAIVLLFLHKTRASYLHSLHFCLFSPFFLRANVCK